MTNPYKVIMKQTDMGRILHIYLLQICSHKNSDLKKFGSLREPHE